MRYPFTCVFKPSRLAHLHVRFRTAPFIKFALFHSYFFKKNIGQSRPLFVYFCSFHIPFQMTNLYFVLYKLKKRRCCVLGIRTRGCRIVGDDDSTELFFILQMLPSTMCKFSFNHLVLKSFQPLGVTIAQLFSSIKWATCGCGTVVASDTRWSSHSHFIEQLFTFDFRKDEK